MNLQIIHIEREALVPFISSMASAVGDIRFKGLKHMCSVAFISSLNSGGTLLCGTELMMGGVTVCVGLRLQLAQG
jgi:hypothetical protein